jgi:hypothetical protein
MERIKIWSAIRGNLEPIIQLPVFPAIVYGKDRVYE